MCLDPCDSAPLYSDMAVDDQLGGSNVDVRAAGIFEEFKLSPMMRDEYPTAKRLCIISEAG